MNQRKFETSSEKNFSQKDWLADEAENLADGEPNADDGEPRKPNRRKGVSPTLPRIQKYLHLSDEQRERTIETFFVKIKE